MSAFFHFDFALDKDPLSKDLQSFAKHGRRQTVSNEDVKLCARKSKEILRALEKFETDNGLAAAQVKSAKAKRKSLSDKTKSDSRGLVGSCTSDPREKENSKRQKIQEEHFSDVDGHLSDESSDASSATEARQQAMDDYYREDDIL